MGEIYISYSATVSFISVNAIRKKAARKAAF
ncbi:uncharacterized protein METZ01_LOCUS312951 [marine metagenome]|uniref:Uncharacterized protein n=1 Tax=marine metagenome TaxID=408172 RepID=A0A382NIJ4_9ZZZZ